MSNITVASGQTYQLRTHLTPSDTVTLQPDSLLITNKLSFIASAGDITLDAASGSERAAALEIKHVAPVIATEFMYNELVLEFASGKTTVLQTLGTPDDGSIHPYQTKGGTFYLAPASFVPANAHSIPTTFYV
jgi:hypothetical protein